ncbi:MAG: hypothetical protein ACK5NT_02750 [Pyrinomonadaceae bacterium]
MKNCYKIIMFVAFAALFYGCGNKPSSSTPLDTLKAYSLAAKNGDVAMMKNLISNESLKLHEEQAKARNVSVDEILKTETLFPANQKTFNFRNEKINGVNATIEVQNDFGEWETIYLVQQDGVWKIDKKGFADNIIEENDAADKKLDDLMNKDRQSTEEELNNTNLQDTNVAPEALPPGETNSDILPPAGATPNDTGVPDKNVEQKRAG